MIGQLIELSPEYFRGLDKEKASYEQILTAVNAYNEGVAKTAEIKALLPQYEAMFKKVIDKTIELNQLKRLKGSFLGLDGDEYTQEEKKITDSIRGVNNEIRVAKKFLTELAAGTGLSLSEILFGKKNAEVKEAKIKVDKVKVENIGKIEFSDDKEALKLPVEFDFKSAMDINKSGAFRPFLDAMKKKPILIPITIDFNKEKEFKKMEDIAKTIMQLQENFAKSTKAIYENTIVGAAQAIGEGIGNIISGEGGIGDMFKGISKIMGSGVKQFGQEILKLAILAKLAQKAIPNPVTGIFAGLALIALGTAIENATQRNAFASGTTRFAGGTALVGERGPELVSLPSGSSVMPNNQLQAFGNGGINLLPSIAYDGTMFRIFLNRVDAQISRNG